MTDEQKTTVGKAVPSPLMTAATIFAVDDVEIEKVELPEPYKGHIYMKNMDGDEWDTYQDSIVDKDDDGNRTLNLKQSRAKMITRCACNEKGELIFTDGDIPTLCKKSAKLLEHLTKVAQRLNGMGEEKKKEKN